MVTTLYVDGMRSAHCVRCVFTALGAVEGIINADVSMGRAIVEHERESTDAAMTAAITALGYTVREIVTQRRRLTILADSPDQSENQ